MEKSFSVGMEKKIAPYNSPTDLIFHMICFTELLLVLGDMCYSRYLNQLVSVVQTLILFFIFYLVTYLTSQTR